MIPIPKRFKKFDEWLRKVKPREADVIPAAEKLIRQIVDLLSQRRFEELKGCAFPEVPGDEYGFTTYSDPTPEQIAAHFDSMLVKFGIDHIDSYDTECTSTMPDGYEEAYFSQLHLYTGSTERDCDYLYIEYHLTTGGRLNGIMLSAGAKIKDNGHDLGSPCFSLERDNAQAVYPINV